MKHRITLETDTEDRLIVVEQRGRRVIVTTDRPGVASAIARKLVEAFEAPDDPAPEPRIGFPAE